MTNKRNVEIIEEELKKTPIYHYCEQRIKTLKTEWGKDKWQKSLEEDTKQFATTLLSKLNIPEEGEVIAEGVINRETKYGGIYMNHKGLSLYFMLEKYLGKKGRLVFIEDKEE